MKVYLSKSNRSDPHVVDVVRTDLKRAGLEVVEFHGGTYSHTPMIDCEVLVVVPPAEFLQMNDAVLRDYGNIHIAKGYGCQIGKGQSEQITTFLLKSIDNQPQVGVSTKIIIAECACSDMVEYGWFESHRTIVEGDWKVNYAYLKVTPIYFGIEQHIEEMDLEIPKKIVNPTEPQKLKLKSGVTQHPDGRYYEEKQFMDKQGRCRVEYTIVEDPYIYEEANLTDYQKKIITHVSKDESTVLYMHKSRNKNEVCKEEPMLACITLLGIKI